MNVKLFQKQNIRQIISYFHFLKNKTENKNSTLEMIIKNTFELEI